MGYANISGPLGLKITKNIVDGLKLSVVTTNDQISMPLNKIRRMVVHWTAGPYDRCYNEYHYNIVFDKKTGKAHVVKTLLLTQLGKHTWHYNTGSVGLSFCAMQDATEEDHGPCPIVDEMLQVGARFAAEFCCWHNLDPAKYVEDHAVVDARLQKSGKWDITPYWPEFKRRMLNDYAALKTGEIQFMYKGILTD